MTQPDLFAASPTAPKKGTQNARLLGHLKRTNAITPLLSWEVLGIYRLSARVNDLRNMGHDIKSTIVKRKNRWGEVCRVAEYKLEV